MGVLEMDLLDMLMGSMATQDSVQALSEKTGASTEQTQKLLASSLPLLVGSMTNNAAASTDGVRSLRGALTQHTNTRKASEQIMEADVEDGEKIVRHILGDNTDVVVHELAVENGMSDDQVTRGLASMAPLLLSILSAVMGKAAKFDLSDGLDLTDILALFGGSQQSAMGGMGLLGSLLGMGGSSSGGLLGNLFGSPKPQQSMAGGLLGGLLGGAQPQQNVNNGGLLGGLLGGAQPQQSVNNGGLLGSLLGGGQTPQNNAGGLASMLGSVLGSAGSQGSANTFNGMDLLSMLLK